VLRSAFFAACLALLRAFIQAARSLPNTVRQLLLFLVACGGSTLRALEELEDDKEEPVELVEDTELAELTDEELTDETELDVLTDEEELTELEELVLELLELLDCASDVPTTEKVITPATMRDKSFCIQKMGNG
jgi:hypothetical protein